MIIVYDLHRPQWMLWQIQGGLQYPDRYLTIPFISAAVVQFWADFSWANHISCKCHVTHHCKPKDNDILTCWPHWLADGTSVIFKCDPKCEIQTKYHNLIIIIPVLGHIFWNMMLGWHNKQLFLFFLMASSLYCTSQPGETTLDSLYHGWQQWHIQ